MDVAVVSVVLSGHVALGSIAANYWTARDQRRHESALAYESRV